MTDKGYEMHRYMTPDEIRGRAGRKQIRIHPSLEARMTAWLHEQGMTWADWIEREAQKALNLPPK